MSNGIVDTVEINHASRIVVAIPTLNEEAHIEHCLTSLGLFSQALSDAVFVVCDGGSADKTREIVQRLAADAPNLVLIDNALQLQSAGLNAVVASEHVGNRDILVRCDAHAIYPENYVLRLADSLTNQGTASVVVSMDSIGNTCFARAASWTVDTPFGSGGAAHRGGTQSRLIEHGHHAAFDIGWFRKIGGYDPTFSHNEDAEYDHRLALAGGKIWLDGEIRLKYIMRPSISGLFRQYRNYGRGRMRTLKKHRMMPKIRQVLPIALVANLIFSTLLGWLVHPLLYLGTAAYAAILLAVSIALAFKHRSFCALWAGPALATMHISWAFGALEKFFSSD